MSKTSRVVNLRPTTAGNSGQKGSGNGNPPGDDGMEKRVEILEKAIPDIRERLVRVEAKLESIERHGATKADIESVHAKIEAMGRTMIQWSIGTAVVLAGIAFTAARFIPGG